MDRILAGRPSGDGVEAPPPNGARPGRRPDIDAKALVGKSEAELIGLLGRPARVRNEPPAMVWNYEAGTCRLDVFFYFDMVNEDFRSLAYRFYPETRSEDTERACLKHIRDARAVSSN